MKKQILTLAVCLALSASSVLASNAKSANSNSPKSPTCAEKPADMPKFKSPEEAKKFFEAKMAQKRQEFYKELCLTDAQKTKAEALDAKTKADFEALHKKFKDERKQLLKSSKADFEAILTKEQKAKLEKLEQEHKAKFEKMKKEHAGACPTKGPKGPKCHQGPPPFPPCVPGAENPND